MCALLQATAELKARLAEVEAQDATLQQQLQEAQDRVTALETQLAEAQAAVASGGIPQSPGGLCRPLFAQLRSEQGWALVPNCHVEHLSSTCYCGICSLSLLGGLVLLRAKPRRWRLCSPCY